MVPLPKSKRKHQREAGHLLTCPDCRAAVERERQYLQRLRSAEIPAASSEFTARLLERTHVLAAASQPESSRRAPAVRLAAVAATGALAAAGLLTAAALVLAGDPKPYATLPVTSPDLAFLSPPRSAADPSGAPAEGGPGTPVSEAGSVPLTAADLAALRNAGWACPELRAMGYQLQSARALWLQGAPVIELRLRHEGQGATVFEQRARAGSSAGSVPVSLLTGRPATEDGFVPAAELPAGLTPGQGAETAAWLRAGNPAGAIYRSGTATVSYFADAGSDSRPGHSSSEVLQELALANLAAEQDASVGHPEEAGSAAAEEQPGESLGERLGRGFRVLLGLPDG